ncbi:hypothetical protein PIB30_056254 [Stylosanthes scabra]|uniref:Reverse transcriptase zinc-binding domain-containing protein n=1 Tax=Stylosanthes scabra TaxID=79078 RepID=A0ABU6YI52_9FABA|nr:hypothetical protein [Stylosanthes scabra]
MNEAFLIKRGWELLNQPTACWENGEFTVRDTYRYLAKSNDWRKDKSWRRIWKWKGVQRIKVFMWQLNHNSLLTSSRMARDWIRLNLEEEMGKNQRRDWKDVFMVIAWLIWKNRNEFVHSNKRLPSRNALTTIDDLVEEIVRGRGEEHHRENCGDINIHWHHPRDG